MVEGRGSAGAGLISVGGCMRVCVLISFNSHSASVWVELLGHLWTRRMQGLMCVSKKRKTAQIYLPENLI